MEEKQEKEPKKEDIYEWEGKSEFELLQAHLGHDIEIAQYGEQNIAIECLTCSVVLYDADK